MTQNVMCVTQHGVPTTMVCLLAMPGSGLKLSSWLLQDARVASVGLAQVSRGNQEGTCQKAFLCLLLGPYVPR